MSCGSNIRLIAGSLIVATLVIGSGATVATLLFFSFGRWASVSKKHDVLNFVGTSCILLSTIGFLLAVFTTTSAWSDPQRCADCRTSLCQFGPGFDLAAAALAISFLGGVVMVCLTCIAACAQGQLFAERATRATAYVVPDAGIDPALAAAAAVAAGGQGVETDDESDDAADRRAAAHRAPVRLAGAVPPPDEEDVPVQHFSDLRRAIPP